MIRSAKFWPVLWALGCAEVVPLTEIPTVPRLPFVVADDIRGAVDAANTMKSDAPRWRIVNAHEAAGHVVEHYRLGRGMHLLLSVDPTSTAFVHSVWFDTRHLMPGHRDALAALLTDRNVETAALDRVGAVSDAGVSRELGYAAVLAPGDFEAVARHQASRIGRRGKREAIERTPRQRVDLKLERAVLDTLWKGKPELDPSTTMAPQRLAFVIAGSVDRRVVLQTLRTLHSSLGAPAESVPRAPEIRNTSPAFPLDVRIDADERELWLSWDVSGASVDEHMALEAAAHVLSIAFDLSEAKALALRARSPVGARTFDALVVLDPAATATVSGRRVQDELARIARGETTGRELERARLSMTNQTLRASSGLMSRAELFASALLLEGSPDAIDLRIAALDLLSEQGIRDAVKRFVTSRGPIRVLGRPEGLP